MYLQSDIFFLMPLSWYVPTSINNSLQ
jgi:hypothetical protein